LLQNVSKRLNKESVMESRFSKSFLSIFILFFSINNCDASNNHKRLQDLYRNIGDNLITIRKDYAGTQSTIYFLLDQVGKLYTISKKSLDDRSQYKRLFKKERARSGLFKKEAINAKKKMFGLQNKHLLFERKLQKNQGVITKIVSERDRLSKEQEDLKVMTHEFDKEKYSLTQERDSLIRERNALLRERDLVLRERDTLLRERGEIKTARNLVKQRRAKITPRA